MKIPKLFNLIITGIIGSLIFVLFFGTTTAIINPFETEISVDIFKPGYTDIVLPPLGEVKAKTHLSPFGLRVMLKNINMEAMMDEINNFNKVNSIANLQTQLKDAIKKMIYKLLFLSFIGGGISAYLFNYRKKSDLVLSGLIGLVVISIFIMICFTTYDYNSFANAEYSGTLNNAGWLINLAKEGISKIEQLGSIMKNMAKNIYLMTDKIDSKMVFDAEEKYIKILHISDIHNNVVALEFVDEIVESFDIDIIIDTGDITDFGTPLEASLVEKIDKLNCPYVFVAGNHDSPAIIEKMKSLNNTFVLENEFITLKNIKILGVPDPISLSSEKIKPPQKDSIKISVEKADIIVEENENEIDILATHNPQIANRYKGQIPTILFGHTHTFSMTEENESLMINAGTTGGAGIRGLQSTAETPYSMAVIYFDKNDLSYPILVDIIKLYNIKKGIVLERVWSKDH
ncbi:MAG TPA: hypothetical protein GX526_07330 [Thermoanaerobacterales bacterium]|nr:hypothetical protein [Thermoanaerobacterales bacterium]